MQLEQFIADSAADAAAQIRTRLGPEAVVVNVRELPGRLWKKSRIEVMAHVPLQERPDPAPTRGATTGVVDAPLVGAGLPTFLTSLGFLPRYAEQVAEQVGECSPVEQLQRARSILFQLWPPRRAAIATGPHIFLGAPGVGKTTALCKWLTQAVLLDGRSARVWQLDGRAELLSVHGDILGVPVERSWTGEPVAEELGFIDLSDPSDLSDLPAAQRHLVLNAAYETPVLLAQARAFAELPVADLIITHLDEVPCWGKLWNLVLDCRLPIRFLGAGQNIPGDFFAATAERLLAHDFPLK